MENYKKLLSDIVGPDVVHKCYGGYLDKYMNQHCKPMYEMYVNLVKSGYSEIYTRYLNQKGIEAHVVSTEYTGETMDASQNAGS